MDIPENCRVCMYASSCHAWYGGTGCLYRDQVKP